MEFKGLESFANYGKSLKVSILDLYISLYIKNFHGISDNNTSLQEFVLAERGIIIQGEPGSGKSTFLRYIVRSNLDVNGNFLPFIIPLKNFATYVENKDIKNIDDAKKTLIQFIREEYPQPKFLFNSNFLESYFDENEGWFLFDGFDEITSIEVKNKISKMIQMLYDVWDRSKFIITSRPYAIDENIELLDFQKVHIDMLHRPQMEKYIDTFADLIGINQYAIDANGLITQIYKNNTIYQLAKTPVMLTFICIIYFLKENIPESRFEIYEKIIYWLIRSKEKDPDNQEKEMQLYSRIAFYISENNMISNEEIDEDTLYNLFGKGYNKKDFIKHIINVGIIIKKNVGMENKKLRFWHFCFQEYLTAKYLSNEKIFEEACEYIIDKWFDKSFSEITILYASSLYNKSLDHIVAFVDKISKYILSLSTNEMIKGASLLGRVFEELYPEKNYLEKSTHWLKLKNKLKIVFIEPLPEVRTIDKCNAAIAYGLSGDERLFEFKKTFVKIDKGSFYIGSQNRFHWGRNYDPLSTCFEQPVKKIHISEFEIRKYPITVEEFEQFIVSDGYLYKEEIWNEQGLKWKLENDVKYPRNWKNQICLRNTPVTGVSWYEAVAYCNWLTLINNDGYVYRLPSEAEWEYAYKFCHSKKIYSASEMNCYTKSEDIQNKTPVGMFPSSTSYNGVADMLGNIEEWCLDSWSISLDNSPINGEPWIDCRDFGAVTRGGSTIRTKRLCRPSYRARCNKDTRYDTIGFRIIRAKREG